MPGKNSAVAPIPLLLVIDSDLLLLQGFRRFLQESEVRLLTAGTAAEGLRLFAGQRPDAVILGLVLPDLPGLEVLRRLRELDARAPVIIMTGHGTAAAAIEAAQLGAFDFLLKPQGFARLHDLVTAAFRVSRAARVPAGAGGVRAVLRAGLPTPPAPTPETADAPAG